MADEFEISREELRKMTSEERIKTLRALQAAKQKQLQEEISEASEMIEETEEEIEQLEESGAAEEEDEEPASLEEVIAEEEVGTAELEDQYQTGAEYGLGPPGAEYGTEDERYDTRVGEPRQRMDEPRDRLEQRERDRPYDRNEAGPNRRGDDDTYLTNEGLGRGARAKNFLDDMYNR